MSKRTSMILALGVSAFAGRALACSPAGCSAWTPAAGRYAPVASGAYGVYGPANRYGYGVGYVDGRSAPAQAYGYPAYGYSAYGYSAYGYAGRSYAVQATASRPCGVCASARPAPAAFAPAYAPAEAEAIEAPALSDSFFEGGLSGGAGPGNEIAGGGGGGWGGDNNAAGFGAAQAWSRSLGAAYVNASLNSRAYASASASASASAMSFGGGWGHGGSGHGGGCNACGGHK